MAGQLERLECDVLVVGGGVNGAGIARDAAGRGLSVILCEKDDLAAHTSSCSSKLIHGGLRYLEYYAFGMVRKALLEREVLLRSAPHIMWPLRFVMPHDEGQRPAWMIRSGLFLYDSLARREFLPSSGGVDLPSHPAGAPLKQDFIRGFEYSDGWVDDARLVVLNCLDAAERGATILTRTACTSIDRGPLLWTAQLQGQDGKRYEVDARLLVNATGPWASSFRKQAGCESPSDDKLRQIKGSHIVVPSLFDHGYAYIFQHPDKRIVFALPYERDFTLIGTTDVDYKGDPGEVAIDKGEIDYLCELANRYFNRQIARSDVAWSYSGVRPIVEDSAKSASAAGRDYKLEQDTVGGAPMLTVLGGKITTFRKLSEQAVDWIAPTLGCKGKRWTAHALLPGADLYDAKPTNRGVMEFDKWVQGMQKRFSWLSPALVARYARAYGTRIMTVLAHCRTLADLGPEIVPGLYAAEVYYLTTHEWAVTAEDILWRRSKLGLHVPEGSTEKLDAWLMASRRVS